MVLYLKDKIPVESLAFPYLFYEGGKGKMLQYIYIFMFFFFQGTWKPLRGCSISLAEYTRIRSLCYDSVASLDRSYIFTLYCEKVFSIL